MPMTRPGYTALIILATIGAIAIVAFLIMLLMHGRMMGGQRAMRGRVFEQPGLALAAQEVVA